MSSRIWLLSSAILLVGIISLSNDSVSADKEIDAVVKGITAHVTFPQNYQDGQNEAGIEFQVDESNRYFLLKVKLNIDYNVDNIWQGSISYRLMPCD